jgi:phosphocarrier protein
MVSRKVVVKDELGLHMRPAKELCSRAVEFETTKIMLHFRNREFNAKSVLGVLSACARYGDEMEIVCSGSQEEEALQALAELFTVEET